MIYLQSDNTIDVISTETSSDYQLFFGPTNGIPLVTSVTNIGEVLLLLGLIESKGWARKNGWWRDIQPGLQCFTFGKNKIKIWVYTIPGVKQ